MTYYSLYSAVFSLIEVTSYVNEYMKYIDVLSQDWCISSALAMERQQSCPYPWLLKDHIDFILDAAGHEYT